MPFSMTSSFWVSRQHGHRLGLILFILCLLYVGKSPGELQSISEANNSGLQTQQGLTGQAPVNLCRGRFLKHRKNGNPTFSESSEDEDQCAHQVGIHIYKACE